MEIYRVDKKLTELLSRNKFTISAEVIPPRNGTPQNEIINQIKKIVSSGAAFMSVTKGAGGSLRGGSLPIAQVIKDHFQVPCIAHFTTRDLSPEDCENQLIDHHYFGIRNILALRGDPPQGVTNWQPKDSSYPYAYQLIEQIKKLNAGIYIERKNFSKGNTNPTDFCIGAAAYPDSPSVEERIGYFKRKVEAGAEYGITQMLYDPDSYEGFIDSLAQENCHIPILPGARILKSKPQALRMQERFQMKIPKWYIDGLGEQEDKNRSIDLFLQLVEKLKAKGAPGLHVFVLVDTELASEAIRSL